MVGRVIGGVGRGGRVQLLVGVELSWNGRVDDWGGVGECGAAFRFCGWRGLGMWCCGCGPEDAVAPTEMS